jgi:CO/xanthine dehydrogenase FAD-binding subunit
MRSFLPRYELVVPQTFDEALRLLAEDGDARPFAGGTDLMVLLEAGSLPPTRYVSVWNLAELKGIRVETDSVVLGALTTYADVLADRTLAAEFPMLGHAARDTGGIATQNRGTIGGNIANASPAADTPPALLAYDAELELVSVHGVRRVPYATFHIGYKKMDLAPGEMIAAVRLPRGAAWSRQAYRKVGTRQAQAISKVCFAGALRLRDGTVEDVRLAFGSVSPTCIRASAAEAALRGRPLTDETIAAARASLSGDIVPIDDIRSTARYRARVAVNLMSDFLSSSL